MTMVCVYSRMCSFHLRCSHRDDSSYHKSASRSKVRSIILSQMSSRTHVKRSVITELIIGYAAGWCALHRAHYSPDTLFLVAPSLWWCSRHGVTLSEIISFVWHINECSPGVTDNGTSPDLHIRLQIRALHESSTATDVLGTGSFVQLSIVLLLLSDTCFTKGRRHNHSWNGTIGCSGLDVHKHRVRGTFDL